MTLTPSNFFDLPEPDPIRQGGRPMLIPRGLEGSGTRVPYSRASSLADNIEAKDHIHKWEQRYLARGMGMRPDLCQLAAVETYSTGLTAPTIGREKSASGKRLDSIIERALDTVQIHEKADRGTAVHAATEPVNSGYVPEGIKDDVKSFWEIVRRESIEIVGTEMFTANDTTMSAGTFDHLMRFVGHPLLTGLVVTDKKTGRYAPHEWAVQISSYANGDVYDTSNDTRPAWPGQINLDWAVVFQIGDGVTKMHVLDIRTGWEAAQHAAWVRDYHDHTGLAAAYRPPSFDQRLAASMTLDDLRRLWESTDDPALRARVEQRVSSL